VQAVAIVPAIAAIYVAVALVAKSLTWYWPSQPGAMANEAALALGALLGGAAFMRFQPKARAAVAAGAAAIYTALSAGGLAIVGPEAPGLGRYRHYVFAPSACEFAVRFPGPPQVQDEAIAVGGGTTATVIARWSDFGALAAWRAECIPAPAGGSAERLEAAMRAWADASGLGQAEIGVATKDGMAVASLSGRLGGAIIDMSDGPASTRIESRIHGGKSSLMRLTVAQPGRAPLSPQAQAFLDSVTWRDAP
jgi:hypothetical protein